MAKNDEIVEADVIFQVCTGKGVCVNLNEGGKDIWLPKKLVSWEGHADRHERITIEGPQWLFEREGLA